MRYLKIACIWVLSLLANSVFSADFQPKITYFYDGDTVKIQDGPLTYKLRFTDIDAPERNQAYGKKSKRALVKLCKHAQVHVRIVGMDKYHRQLGQLTCNQRSVNEFMVANGHAWFNQRYSADIALAQAEFTARQQKRGLWQQKNPMPPWVWRQRHPH
jgi:endonuclease YncB( thermonuclease family)